MKFITILLTVFALKSCGNTKVAASALDNVDTKQTEILSGTYTITLTDNNLELPENMHLTFDEVESRVSGFAGCNNFSGKYSTNGNTIKIGPLMSTKMYCEKFMELETKTLNTLAEVNAYAIKDGVLSLLNDDKTLMEGTKDTSSKVAQGDEYTIEYIAQTRGSYKMISIKNNILSYQKERGSDGVSRACTSEEVEAIAEKLSKLDLEVLKVLEAPTQKRLHDGALAATVKVIHNGKTYETPGFDDGSPNEYIADLVHAITSMTEKN